MPGFALALLALLPGEALAHGILVRPETRPAAGMRGDGAKLTPFSDAANIADNGCGGVANGDPGVQIPRQAFLPGSQFTVDWDLTIPHTPDNTNTGVRIAIHYGPQDSFAQNILVGGVFGSGVPGFSAEPAAGETRQTVTVTLPSGSAAAPKTCDYCTVQWVWAASSDGGLYVGCADIAITANGQMPDFSALPSEEGNVLPGVPASAAGPGAITTDGGGGGGGGGGGDGDDGGGGAGAAVGYTFLVLFIGAGCVYVYVKYFREDSKKAPPPPPSTYGNAMTPASAMQQVPPPPPQPTAGILPPGWTSAVDPGSGSVYYVNMATGMTQWTPPAHV